MDQLVSDLVVIYGRKRRIDQQSTFLFDDLLDDYIDGHEHRKILQPWALEKIRLVCDWLVENDISEDESMLAYLAYKRVQTFDTSVRYYLHLDRPEHRVLFSLCRENILGDI